MTFQIISVELRVCRKCHTEKPLEEFGRNANYKDEIDTTCKECGRERSREWREENPDKRVAVYTRHNAKPESKRYRRDWLLKTRYQIDLVTFERILAEQGGVCAFDDCNSSDRLCYDHCHKTGVGRGILCNRHNRGLGHFEDDIIQLRAALAYLERFNGL